LIDNNVGTSALGCPWIEAP